MSKLDKETVISSFTEAYKQANGKAPSIEAKGGWYSVDGGKNMRLAQLAEEAENLAKSAPKAEKKTEKKAEKKTEDKKEAKAAPKKASKPKASKKAKPAKTFSVKDFYTQQIQANNPGSKAPR